jgi:lipoprotein-anchoring transpeptidase ErfK/SrfK
MRRVLIWSVMLAVAASLFVLPAGSASAAPSSVQSLADEIYFQQTGHHVSGAFLRYWWNQGGLDIFGFPLTEKFEVNGVETQYFERARFEYYPDNDANFRVLLGHLGRALTAGRQEAAFNPITGVAQYQDSKDRRFFSETGHFLAYGFKSYWEQNGGLYIFGLPISEEFSETGADGVTHTVQYFERARFEYHPEFAGTRYAVELGRIGDAIGQAAKVSMTPVAQKPGTPVWPNGMQTPAKWIEVDLSLPQTLTAWEGDTPVYTTYVSGGTDTHPTVTGTFSIYWKLDSQDMTGGLAGTDSYYYLPDVPWVMYFYEDYAIHGAYWHANWGYPISHGCVNMTISDANWLYHWAPYGTKVWVHH